MASAANLDLVLAKFGAFVKKLEGSIHVSDAFLFGSYAKGTATPESDIDVLVLSPDFSGDRFEDLLLLMKVRQNIDLRIEPHPFRADVFNESHPFFQEVKDSLIRIL